MTERDHELREQLADLARMRDEELLPELQPWVEEDGPLGGPMLRHPLVYDMMVSALPGQANHSYRVKRKALDDAIDAEDWHTVVFLHERPYRLRALIDYVTGRDFDEDGKPMLLDPTDEVACAVAADVWVDSENINQVVDEWRALIGDAPANGLWLGTTAERAEFDALPDPIPAWRGGTVGDWSWTTSEKVAQFFARRSGYEPRFALIPKADCFGYLTRRNEDELLVRLTPERHRLVYPDRFQKP